MTLKIPKQIFIPPKIILLKTTKIMKFKFRTQKNDPSLRMYESIKEPPRGGSVIWSFLPVVDGILNWKCTLQYGFKGSAVAQWYSGWLETEGSSLNGVTVLCH